MFVCPTCGSDVDVTDIKPELQRVKNGWHARDALRRIAAFGHSQPLALANLKGGVGAYERGLARYRAEEK